MGFLDILDPLGIFDKGDTPNYAGKSAKAYHKNLGPLYDKAKGESDSLFGATYGTYGDILTSVREGYGNARENVAEQGRVGTQGIRDAQTQALAATQQAAISSGLSGSSAHGAANRGVASDTARQIAGLQASLGNIYAGLDIGQANAEASALSGLASAQQNQAGAAQNFLGLQFSGINQQPIAQEQEGPLGGILQGLLQAVPFMAASGGV